ncbi:serine/threonine-protein kinase HAL4/sat4 [Lobosporangium transversale]|uniref:Kinase-like domain-containing protein n=1 Tax=Lobosporangium transversale TaxID=64571 RepID=A0A1Y2GNY4_9FUNG|nr:kinase-like domain-containing protein [Lobosporangium transversale]KAF9914699.1 serine/threonine-protein kinase HAL4/sat4 [Lobosporangium transversale]ORZ14839.1 kinase-like domain-containing protein [Lobosporangium transversale]|eukprot:XP_021880971.1 kinase-like domain-containing protein [Lobosporangium transversale]
MESARSPSSYYATADIQPGMQDMALEHPHEPVSKKQQEGFHINTSTTTNRSIVPLTAEALAAQGSRKANSNFHSSASIAAATQYIPELHLQRRSPAPSDQYVLSERPSSIMPTTTAAIQPRGTWSHVLEEIPSAKDNFESSDNHHIGSTARSHKSHSVASSNSDTAQSSGHSSENECKDRFERLPNGGHRHHLSAPKRHQHLVTQIRRLKGLLDGGKKDREKDRAEKDEKKERHSHRNGHGVLREALEHPLSLLNEKIEDFEKERGHHHHANKHSIKEEFAAKYGDLQQVVGRGAFGIVRLSVKKDPETGEETTYAVKEFRHDHNEAQRTYMRRLTSEFCIASSLRHINVIQTLDLLQLHGDAFSEVMEYCPGGDVHSLIASSGTLSETESSCFFAQLINGVAFLHSIGVVHRDLKPENLLLTADGCIKIADFGNSEVFRMPWEKKIRSSTSIRGSGPFIAPEEFTTKTFDGRKVDMWACGIIYMCMRRGRYSWAEASKGDPNWDGVLYKIERWQQMQEALPEVDQNKQAHGHAPKHIHLDAIEQTLHISLGWPNHISEVLNHLLDPNPKTRWQAGHVLDSEWMEKVDNCHPAERPADQVLNESDFDPAPSQRVGSKVWENDNGVMGDQIMNEVKNRCDKGSQVNDSNGANANPLRHSAVYDKDAVLSPSISPSSSPPSPTARVPSSVPSADQHHKIVL